MDLQARGSDLAQWGQKFNLNFDFSNQEVVRKLLKYIWTGVQKVQLHLQSSNAKFEITLKIYEVCKEFSF